MKTTRLAPLLIGVLCLSCDRGEQTTPQQAKADSYVPPKSGDELAVAFIAAVNSNDPDNMRAMLHPACVASITEENESFFNEMFEYDVSQVLPKEYKLSSEPVEAGEPLLMEGMLTYAVRPTKSLQIDFDVVKDGVVTWLSYVRYVTVEDGGWWIVLGTPTAEAMAEMQAARAEDEKIQQHAVELVAKLGEPLLGEIKALLKQGLQIDAIKHYRAATDEGLATAEAVVELIAEG